MFRSLLLLLTFFTTLSLAAQRPGGGRRPAGVPVTGVVTAADTDAPLDYATISFYRLRDSSLVEGTISDIDGKFNVALRPGKYYVLFEYLAYQTYVLPELAIEPGGVVDLGRIGMEEGATSLDEVVVSAERSTMQMSLDKKIFNVGKDMSSQGGNAADLLDNVPSIQVSVEGEVSLRGSSNVRILINGKPSSLLGGTGGLRGLQANMIEQIEVITNPSARYEAEGMGGIINIILKKNTANGFNGSFDFTVGVPDNYGVAFNLNYRANKFNFFTNYGVSYRRGPGGGSRFQRTAFEDSDSTFFSLQNNERDRGGWNQSLRGGADYYFTEKDILTAAVNVRFGQDDNLSTTRYTDFITTNPLLRDASQAAFRGAALTPYQTTVRTDEEDEDEYRTEYQLTYRKTYAEKDKEWTIDARYQDDTEEEGSDLTDVFFDGDGNLSGLANRIQRSDNKERSLQTILSTDFVDPFGEDGRWEAGARASFRTITNDYTVTEEVNGENVPLPGLTNDFEYDENILAAYVQYGDKFGRFSYLVGLRPEYTQVSTLLKTDDQANDRNYTNFFPSAFLTYEASETNSFQVSYSRRVSRPRFWDLNPFFTFSDNRNFFSGNPNLDPEFTNSFELGHLVYFTGGSLSSALYYRHTTDKIERILRFNPDGSTVRRPENLLTEDAYGLEFTGSYDINKWWKINADLNFYRAITDGGNLGPQFSADTYTMFARGTNRFKFGKKTDAQVRFNYRAPRNTTQGRTLARYHFDVAASHDVMGEKGTLTLSARDLFNTRRRQSIIIDENSFTEEDFQWRARSVTLTLNYRLNQKKRRGGGSGRGDGGGGEY